MKLAKSVSASENKKLRKFSFYRNHHHDQDIVVCGCGSSLKNFNNPDDFITIGVNDVGRLFTPDYLVVLNPKNQFKNDRFQYVVNSRAKALFTQLNLGIKHSNIVRFKLGKRGGTDCSDTNSLPFTRNSPYVAICLAAFMGAKKIGLIGVDFTDDHFFAKTGRHPLTRDLVNIDKEYKKLSDALAEKGVELVNLSQISLLNSLKKVPIEKFLNQPVLSGINAKKRVNTDSRRVAMNIQIEKHSGAIIGGFFDRLSNTANDLGHTVERQISSGGSKNSGISIVWNGRRYRNKKNVIYCEHGWLPREAYQVSPEGINADSHIAPFSWDEKPLSAAHRKSVLEYLTTLKNQGTNAQEYTSTSAPVTQNLPSEFLLVPLQLEHDTNIVRHVSPNLRRMQSVVDFISRSNPPYPVIYKQHPADVKKGNRHLHLKMRRSIDRLRRHDMGNIHQILKSGRCKGIISLNSNVVHDGFLWEVPAIVLGRNIWPRKGASPFLNGLPKDWSALGEFYVNPSVTACRESYIHYLMGHQWSLGDADNADKVGELFERKFYDAYGTGKLVSLASRKKKTDRQKVVTVNVVAKNKGWLFEDLKKSFAKLNLPGIEIVSTDKAKRNVDCWLYLRASEVKESPDLSRTVVQIHDQFDDGVYCAGGARYHVRDCAGLSFTHPDQQRIIEANDIDLSTKEILSKPLGALTSFSVRTKLPDKFTVAWIGRPVQYRGEDFKRVNWLVEALHQSSLKDELSIVLIGDRLHKINEMIKASGIESHYFPRSKYGYNKYPNYYQNIDCVVISSEFAAGPNCLFESLASGVPVISTRCGWADELVQNGVNGLIVNSPAEITKAIEDIYKERSAWFSRREIICAAGSSYSLEAWQEENVRLAASLSAKHFMSDLKQASS